MDILQPGDDVIEALWAQFEPTTFVGREQFVRDLAEWEIEPVRVGGKLAFAAMTRGPEFHFASFGTGAPVTRAMIRERLDPILRRHGHVATRTPTEGANRQHRLNLRLGFKAVGADEFFVHYRLEKSPCP